MLSVAALRAVARRCRYRVVASGSQRMTRRRHLLILLTACIGIIGTTGVVAMVRSYEQRVAVLKFEGIARDRLSVIESDFNVAEIVLRTLRSLLESVDRPVTREEFINFSTSLHSFAAGLRDTVWAPRVTAAERPAFERSLRGGGFPNFEIREPDPDGKLVRAGERDVYFPILYAEGDPRANKLIGVDFGFDEVRRDVIRRAQRSGAPASTPPLRLLTIPVNHVGLLSALTVTGRDPVAGAPPLGIVLTVFDAVDMIDTIISKKASLAGLDIYVFGPASDPESKPVYPRESANDGVPTTMEALLNGPHFRGVLMIADQPWSVVFRPSTGALTRFGSWSTITLLVIGLVFTLKVLTYLVLAGRRTARLEALTRDLRRTGEDLGKNMAQVRYLAHHDQLTGLPNRRVFYESLQSALGGLSDQRPIFLLYLDLDRFKSINDILGHAGGDQLLCEAASRMRACIRENDALARLGGDEFAIIANTTETLAGAYSLAERLIEAVSEPYTIGGNVVAIGLSVGIASAPEDGDTIERLQIHADHALYAAKNAGRGTVRLFARSAEALATAL